MERSGTSREERIITDFEREDPELYAEAMGALTRQRVSQIPLLLKTRMQNLEHLPPSEIRDQGISFLRQMLEHPDCPSEELFP